MNLSKKFRKIFIGGKWHIAFRPIGSDCRFDIFEAPKGMFCADPIAINANGHSYIFCEQFLKRKMKGCIGYFEFDDGNPVSKGIIIENPYHMSYPFVFCYNNEYYMIPETSENKTIELYKASSFPEKWELFKILLRGENYVDTTVWVDEDINFITYYNTIEGNVLEQFRISSDFLTCTSVNRILYTEDIGRGAGAFFHKNGVLYRPSQNCRRSYGENIIFNKVEIKNGMFFEIPVNKLTLSDIDINIKHLIAVHTYTIINGFEVIDVFGEQLDLTYNIGTILARKIRRRKLKKIGYKGNINHE